MNYAIEMCSGAMRYIPSFRKIGSGIQKLIERDTQAHRQHGDSISLLSCYQNEERYAVTSGVTHVMPRFTT
jgi:hypothetical protein